MSFDVHIFGEKTPVTNAEMMYRAISEYGMLPLCANHLAGFSVEEMTPPECWFSEDELGPWDWKIDMVQSGDIAYGKFLAGGKAAFATVECYRELMNYRRAQKKYQPSEGPQQQILAFMREHGSATVRELRGLLNLKKGPVDALLTRLQMDTLVITGDITRVYRGPDLHYNGWQTSSFCSPDELFDDSDDFPFISKALGARSRAARLPGATSSQENSPASTQALLSASSRKRTPAESYAFLCAKIRSHFPTASDRDLSRILG